MKLVWWLSGIEWNIMCEDLNRETTNVKLNVTLSVKLDAYMNVILNDRLSWGDNRRVPLRILNEPLTMCHLYNSWKWRMIPGPWSATTWKMSENQFLAYNWHPRVCVRSNTEGFLQQRGGTFAVTWRYFWSKMKKFCSIAEGCSIIRRDFCRNVEGFSLIWRNICSKKEGLLQYHVGISCNNMEDFITFSYYFWYSPKLLHTLHAIGDLPAYPRTISTFLQDIPIHYWTPYIWL